MHKMILPVKAAACLALFAVVLSASGVRTRESIDDVRKLKPERAAEGFPVDLEAQVMRTNPQLNNLFVHDGQYGVFVRGPKDASVVAQLKAGDLVRIKGVTTPGGFVPDIGASEIRVVGHQPRPEGRMIRNNDVRSTGNDCEWIQIKGRLLSMMIANTRTAILLEVSRNEDVHYVQIPYSEYNEQRIRELLFSFVKFNAVVGTVYNKNRQAIGRVFFAHSADDFTTSGGEFQMNVERDAAIHELMRFSLPHNRPVRTGGTVLYAGAREMYLRGESACLKVMFSESVHAQVGDEVSIEGIIWPQPVSPAFRASSVRVTGQGKEPVAIKVEPDTSPVQMDSTLNYDLIEIEAELVELGKDFFGVEAVPLHTMRCRSGTRLFEVRMPPGMNPDERLKPGVRFRLTGICNVLTSPERRWYLATEGFWLQLRRGDDIKILMPAPWWTTKRLLGISGILLGAVILFVIWVGMLRKTVNRQTGIIGEKLARESVLTERQRIARELHDTLEQGLTALSVQLKNIRSGFGMNAETGIRSINTAEQMLKVCREESRASIIDLRGGILEKMDLPSAIKHTLELLVKERPVNLDLTVTGIQVQLDSMAERHLLRLAAEAASNAVEHATPKNLQVILSYGSDELILGVRDDGEGFDLKRAGHCGRLGITGMYERANRLHGTLEIETEKGRGTNVSLSMPVREFVKKDTANE